jgi:hypothetical protein
VHPNTISRINLERRPVQTRIARYSGSRQRMNEV